VSTTPDDDDGCESLAIDMGKSPRNIKLTLAYDGTDFSGWQIQPGHPTVQGELADAIWRVTKERLLPQGSGRTDAGVHALEQVASFTLQSIIPTNNLLIALNNTLPESIRATGIEEMPADFHARHSAKAKTYEYRIFRADICPPFIARYVHPHPYPLDEEAIAKAAALVVGEHDFTSFAAVDPERGQDERTTSNVRTIHSSAWRRDGDLLIYTVRGNGFLHHMVRNLVGTFLLVGKGTIPADSISNILSSRRRSEAGPTAPASGLFLVGVEY
jgi:tRNA pseudouridine38-40 synthase